MDIEALEKEGFLSSQKVGKEKIYLNNRLFEIEIKIFFVWGESYE